ncbi:MAG: galactokinase [Anaerolineae bacterium]|nr:galactokinase [Anaerolineae bacterium]
MLSALVTRAIQAYKAQFGESPSIVVRAPGRVNIIGEHTDYNDGFVLPMAIEREIIIALKPRSDDYVVIYSSDYDQVTQFSPSELVRVEDSLEIWAEYVKGVAWSLSDANDPLVGWDGAIAGDVPIGAGLSSSAAIELATARAFATASNFHWDGPVMARLCQRAENEWIGVKSGIMDQMISATGKAGHAVLIDCRSLDTRPVPLPENTVIAIMDTATRRELVTSAYNERREQCEAAAAFFGVPALRDVDLRTFEAREHELEPVIRRRARHVITENDRTLQAADAMSNGDAVRLGMLMNASHTSMRDDFEITNSALNTMVSLALEQPGCFGARMTGGGFGGCAVALVASEHASAFTENMNTLYQAAAGLTPSIFVTNATDGANIIV